MKGFRVQGSGFRTQDWLAIASVLGFAGCGQDPTQPNRLSAMGNVTVKAKEHSFEAWLADDGEERQRGLMFVTSDELKPTPEGRERGMLFVFPQEQGPTNGFWMRNTQIPLDIAFIRSDGRIVRIHTMAPFDERSYAPGAPYRFALEVNAGVFKRLDIKKDDMFEIPESVMRDAR